jgi:hypothetical protein
VLRVRGVAVMGGVQITTRLPGDAGAPHHRGKRALAGADKRALPPRRDG